jgi:hypothetical protein
VFDSPRDPPRLVTTAVEVNGLATEFGGGVEIIVWNRVFVRPKGWLVVMGVSRTKASSRPS